MSICTVITYRDAPPRVFCGTLTYEQIMFLGGHVPGTSVTYNIKLECLCGCELSGPIPKKT